MGSGSSGPGGSVRSAFPSALTTALLIGTLASVAAAGLAAAFVTGRLVHPLDAVRAGRHPQAFVITAVLDAAPRRQVPGSTEDQER